MTPESQDHGILGRVTVILAYLVLALLMIGMVASQLIGLSTALFQWPLSDPATVETLQGFYFAALVLLMILSIVAAVVWSASVVMDHRSKTNGELQ